MSSRRYASSGRRVVLLAAVLLAAGAAVATAGDFSPLPEINERGGHIGYTLARHYSLLIPGRESRFFGGAVFSYAPDVDATLHDLGLGTVLIQNLAGDRVTGAFQLDLATRLHAVYRLPAGRDSAGGEAAGAVPAGFFVESEPYPLVGSEIDLRFITADTYFFPERAFAARAGTAVAFGITDEPYSTAHLTGSLEAVIPLFTPLVQVDLHARYRGYLNPGWLAGTAPASALSSIRLRGYTGTDRLAHGGSASAALAVRLPFEFYVPMTAGGGAYVDAARVSASAAGLVRVSGEEATGAAVAGGFVEHRILAPFRIGSVVLSAGIGANLPDLTLSDPWFRVDYRTGWFFSDPL